MNVDFNQTLEQITSTWQGALRLPEWALIRAEGPDAADFLHGQLSQDVSHLGPDQARLAAYCSAKGRMQASAIVLRPQPDQVCLLTDAGVLPGWLKRLRMFVLRSKVQLSEGGVEAWGLSGEQARVALGDAAESAPWRSQVHAGGQLLRLPDVMHVPRWLWIGPADSAGWLSPLPTLTAQAWLCLEVLSGVPRITPETLDQFVPQMVNFELVGGVNFQKGCYPGQEIVARSQYRGTVKRRLFLAWVDSEHVEAKAGQEVFAARDGEQPVGMVVLASRLPASAGSGQLIQLELKLSAADDELTLAAPGGPRLQKLPLPYALPATDDEA